MAQVELLPLPAFPQFQGTTGTAVMRATASEQLMVVTLHAPRAPGFYEVWLLARDGVSMISLGELNADQTGTFIIPPGTDLRNYSRIDISLQPFNGSTQHSKTSVSAARCPSPPFPLTEPACIRRRASHRMSAQSRYVRISGIVVTFTAASALDATFGTTLFKPGR